MCKNADMRRPEKTCLRGRLDANVNPLLTPPQDSAPIHSTLCVAARLWFAIERVEVAAIMLEAASACCPGHERGGCGWFVAMLSKKSVR